LQKCKKNALLNNYSNNSINTESFVWLNGNHHSASWFAVGAVDEVVVASDDPNGLGMMQTFIEKNKGKYIFGAIAFTLYQELFTISVELDQSITFPKLHLFVPRSVFYRPTPEDAWQLLTGDELDSSLLKEIIPDRIDKIVEIDNFKWEPTLSKDEYIRAVGAIKEHIQRGDVYELNYCYAFESYMSRINAVQIYQQMNKLSHGSFSVFGKFGDHYILGSSPERFIQKIGNRLRSQPIKGTIKRGRDAGEDEILKQQLMHDNKERRENIMIVDLVRNDLSKIAMKGSVQVDELCAIYTFDTVHQMISTVSCELKVNITFIDIICALFPMGSMTGAPKKRALELIGQYEKTSRGIYSGSIGMIHPNGDFDWNVVIRTLVYNYHTKKASYAVGSAITYASDSEFEYKETLLKAQLLFATFNELKTPTI
jgi:para-aminobenzoate synthetase component I